MARRILLGVAIAAMLWAQASAQIGRNGGPVDIKADETIYLTEERMVRWIGKVDARQGDERLLAEQMDIYFAEGSDGEGPGDIIRIVAVGDVAYITPNETARGNRGIYDFEKDEIEITGNVVLVRGRNTSTGERLIVQPSLGRARLVGPAANAGKRGDDRVRAVFFPGSSELGNRENN